MGVGAAVAVAVGWSVAVAVGDGAIAAVEVAGGNEGISVGRSCVQADTRRARARSAEVGRMRRIIGGSTPKVKLKAPLPPGFRVVDTMLGWS